jgi:UDP-3-O-[3-hydroxymyristoyl] glucosamine N-acyltransferase
MSWKKYGGTNKLETMNNLTVNSIVTDSLSLRKFYLGDWDICGGLRVKDNAIIYKDTDLCGNLIVGKDTALMGEFTVFKDANLYGNLVVLNDAFFSQSIYFDPEGNTLLDVNNGGFGFNKYDPFATIDISSDRVQTVYMQTSTIENRNVYAQNVNSQGVVVGVDSGNAYINMFVDQSMNEAGTGAFDGQLRYASGGQFYIDVSNVMNVRPRTVFGADLTKPMNSDADRVVIYDTPDVSYPYLKDIYIDGTIKTGTPLALITQDSDSNVFMRMTTETGNGFTVGGGTFESGIMGVLALTDGADKYPAMNIFSGDLDKYLKTSIGINKHRVSKTVSGSNRYLLDVNGPTKMIHQELLMSYDVSMQIFAMEFYKDDPQIGYAIGSPYNEILSTEIPIFERYYLKTTDGGYTWTRSRVAFNEQTSFESGTSPLFAVHVFSENFALIAGGGGFSSYTIDGGVSWSITDYNFTTDFDINSLFSNLNGSRTIFGLNNGSFIDTGVFGNVNNIGVVSSVNKYPSGLTNILSVHGNNNFVYMVGEGGIQGYTAGTGGVINPSARFFPDSTFVDVSVFYGLDGNCHSVAVGANGLLKYAHASFITDDWSAPETIILDPFSTSGNVIAGSLNSVHVLNERHAIAVGNNGLVIYSDDAFANWKTISHTELDAMGNGEVISALNLTNINAVDGRSEFAIVGDVQDFAAGEQQGRAKVFSFYAPYFFNRAQNFVLEASGSILLSGDLRINDNGNVFTNSNSISLFPDVAIEINIGNTVIGGYTNVKHNLDVIGNAHVYQKLIVDSYSFLNDDVSLNGNLYVTKDASFNSRLFVGGDVSFGSKLYVVDDVSMNSRLFVGGDVSMGSNLYTVGDVSFNSRLFVGGDVSLNSNLYLVDDASFNSRLFVGKDVSLGSKLYVVDDVSLNSRLFVGQDVSLGSKLYVVDDVSMNSRLFVGKDVSLGSKLYVVDDVSMNSRLFVGGDVSLNANLYVVDDVSMNSRLFVGGDVSLNANLYVVKDVSMNSRLFVGGDVSLGSNLYVVGDASFNSRLFVGQDVSFGAKLRVADKSAFESDVSINANLFVIDVSAQHFDLRGTRNTDGVGSGALIVQGGASIGKDLNVGGNLYINNYLDVVDGTDHIHFGYTNTRKMYIGSSDFTDEIRIGTSISGVRDEDVDIYIGSETNSRIHILGNLLLPGHVVFQNQTTLEIINKTILLNDQAAPGTSYGAGLYIREDNNDQAGQILVNPGMSGFFLKAPRSTNIVNFETNTMTLPAGLGRGILTIVPTTTLDGSNYTIARGVVDISDIQMLDASLNNRVMRNPVTTATQVNTQVINGNLSMTGLYVNKLEATVVGNAQVDIAGNAIVSRMGLGSSVVRPDYVLDISGNTFSNGAILQW